MSTVRRPLNGLPDALAEDPRIQAAAWVAETFHLNPVRDFLAVSHDEQRLLVACAEARRRVNAPDNNPGEAPHG